MFNRQGWKKVNLLRQFVACGIMILIVLTSSAIDQPIALGQLPPLTTPSETQTLPVGIERRGTLESASVRLDGEELFRIASPAVFNRSEPGNQIPVEVRAKEEGSLITLPNSLITQVENRARSWARADFRIEVAYNTDVDFALGVVRETVERMAREPEWQTAILDTQELFGVEQISHAGIVIRLWIKTARLKQWAIAMELCRRLKIAFDRNNIQIGIPQQIWLENRNGASKPDPIN